MKLSGNSVLITGGASGIGFALARRLVAAGSEVVICGRRREQLEEARRQCQGLHTLICDVADEAARIALVERVTREFPRLNVLINNAGIQNRPPALGESQDWKAHHQELAINLEAPMHLSMLLLPHLLKQKDPAIINVTSGLAFVPIAYMPTYCATKAALHSFTLSLRHQAGAKGVRVIEVAPPAVNTDLGGKGLHDFGAPLDEFADHAIRMIERGELEFGYLSSEKARTASRTELEGIFKGMNPA